MMTTSLVPPGFSKCFYFLTSEALIVLQIMPPTPRK
jgi:hypothetical protein